MSKDLIPAERIEKKIILLRGQKVMLDRDLAELYEVRTSILKRAVTRNADRFPDDFMFVLDNQEIATLRCQFGTSKTDPLKRIEQKFAKFAKMKWGVYFVATSTWHRNKRNGMHEEDLSALPRGGAGFIFQVLRKYKSRTIYTGSASPFCELCELERSGCSNSFRFRWHLDASALPGNK